MRKRKHSTPEARDREMPRHRSQSESRITSQPFVIDPPSETVSYHLNSDLKDTHAQHLRVFRKGELVWHRVSPPLTDSSGRITIRYWPGIITSSETEIMIDERPPLRYSATSAYRMNLIAVDQFAVGFHREILPFLAHQPSDYIKQFVSGSDVELVSDPAEDAEDSVDYNLLSTLKTALGPYLIALRISQRVTQCYGLDPKFEAPVLAQIPQYKEHVLYRGFWWGPERIWMLDLVRLKPERTQLPQNILDQVLPPLDAQQSDRRRALFFLIQLIHDHPQTGVMITGELYEAISSEGETTGSTHLRNSVHLPKPPPHSEWRKISKTEASFAIALVAGRYYPSALSHPGIAFDDASYWDTKAPQLSDSHLVAASLGGLERGWISQVENKRRFDNRSDAVQQAAAMDQFTSQDVGISEKI